MTDVHLYKKPRYQAKCYFDFHMPDGDMENSVKSHTSHLVLCRKEHKCWNCGAGISKYDHALAEKGFLDGKPVNCWTCLDCVDDYMDMMHGVIDTDEMQARWEARYNANNRDDL